MDLDNEKEEVQLRVASYIRVSTTDQLEKYGPDVQRNSIKHDIESRGKLDDGRPAMVHAGEAYEYVDDISGSSELADRPAFSLLQDEIVNASEGQKPFDAVIVFKIDRFARKLSVLMDVIKFFERYDIKLISVSERIDTSTPFGKAMLGILGVLAELELANIRERTYKGKDEARLKGVFMGGHPKYGYIKDDTKRLVILEKEAIYIRRIFDLFAIDKLSPQKIADILSEEGVLSPESSAIKYGKRKGKSRKLNPPAFWRLENVREILSDDIYIGNSYYGKSKDKKRLPKAEWQLSPYKHKPIILESMFEIVQQRLKEFSERKVLTRKVQEGHIYLLRGLLKCNHCKNLTNPDNQGMMGWTGNKKFIKKSKKYSYYYYCGRKNRKKFSEICTVVPIPAKPIEDYVVNFIQQLLSDPQAVYDYQKELTINKKRVDMLEQRKDGLEDRLNSIPRRKKSIQEQHELNLFDTPTLKIKLADLEMIEKDLKVKIKEIDIQLSRFRFSEGYTASLQTYSEKYGKAFEKILKDREELFNLVHDLVHQVVIYSRPVTKRDSISGRKGAEQMIPNAVDIYLNLPQDLLRSLYSHRFGVKSENVWGHRDSNPEPIA